MISNSELQTQSKFQKTINKAIQTAFTHVVQELQGLLQGLGLHFHFPGVIHLHSHFCYDTKMAIFLKSEVNYSGDTGLKPMDYTERRYNSFFSK